MSEIESVEIIHQQFIGNKPKLSLKQIMNRRVGFFGIQKPAGSCLFADIARFYSVVGVKVERYKSAVNWLLISSKVPLFNFGGDRYNGHYKLQQWLCTSDIFRKLEGGQG